MTTYAPCPNAQDCEVCYYCVQCGAPSYHIGKACPYCRNCCIIPGHFTSDHLSKVVDGEALKRFLFGAEA